MAAADGALPTALLNTSTLSVPATAPEPTTTGQVKVVPPELTVQVPVTAASFVNDVPLKYSATLPEPKPEPVMVKVSGTVPEVPGTIGALGLSAVAVIAAPPVAATPMPSAGEAEKMAALLPFGEAGL
jgi:hypothetical protein